MSDLPSLAGDQVKDNYRASRKNSAEVRIDFGYLPESLDVYVANPASTDRGMKGTVRLVQDGTTIGCDNLLFTSAHRRKTFINACNLDGCIAELVDKALIECDSILAQMLAQRIEAERKEQEQKQQVPELSEEAKAAAMELLRDPRLMYRAGQMIERLGVAGFKENAQLIYLTFTSRLLSEPISITVKGESASGKSYPISKVWRLIPEEGYQDLTDATPQSFLHAKEADLQHKIVVIFERHGAEKADYSIRTLQSEGKLRLMIPVKNPITGEHETVFKELNGPVGFITTTTDPVIHQENETRNFSLYSDDSREQSRRTFKVASRKYKAEHHSVSEDEFKIWRNTQRLLKPYRVVIPYVDSIEKAFPDRPVRVNRDYPRFLAVIECVAFLHQYQRKTYEEDGTDCLMASIADYAIAKILAEDTLRKTIYNATEQTGELIREAQEFRSEIDADEYEVFTASELAEKLGWELPVTRKWLRQAVAGGYIEEVAKPRGSIAGTYRYHKGCEMGNELLPNPVDVYFENEDTTDPATVWNPLTGEEIEIPSKEPPF